MARLRATAVLSEPTANMRLAASPFPDMRNPTFGPLVSAPDGQPGDGSYPRFHVKGVVEGLQGGTDYELRWEVDGRIQPAPRMRARTAADPGAPTSFRVAFASCDDSGSDAAVFDAIRGLNPALFIHLGDHGYPNTLSTDEAAYLANANGPTAAIGFLRRTRQSVFHRLLRVIATIDDHDGAYQPGGLTPNDDPARPEAVAMRAAYVRRYPVNIAGQPIDGLYFAWVEGRVRFVMTDCKSVRSDESKADTAAKSMLGAVQKAWFKDQITAAKAAGQIVVWLSSTPWLVVGASTGSWNVYQTERREIADHVKAQGMAGRMVILSGDLHSVGIDDGTNTDFATGGGAPIKFMNAAPLDRPPSNYTGPLSQGPYQNNQSQFGVLDITDTGGSSIGLKLTGYKAASTTDPTLTQLVTLNWSAHLA